MTFDISQQLDVETLASDTVIGIYRIGGIENRLPKRMLYLNPEAADGFIRLGHNTPIVVSDMFRSPEASLHAIRTRRGARPPGFSGHNFGFSIDIDVEACIRRGKFRNKAALDKVMNAYGWYCHRRDARKGFESWHYDYNVDGILLAKLEDRDETMAPARERMIQKLYGSHWKLRKQDVQAALQELGFYQGDIDGKIGPLSQEAIRAFQRAWALQEDGVPGPVTQRVLWLVSVSSYM